MVDDWVGSCLMRWPPSRVPRSSDVSMVGVVVVGASGVCFSGGFFFFRKCLEMMSGGRKCVDAPSVERLRKHVSIAGVAAASVDGKFHFMSFSIRVAKLFC